MYIHIHIYIYIYIITVDTKSVSVHINDIIGVAAACVPAAPPHTRGPIAYLRPLYVPAPPPRSRRQRANICFC